MNRKHFTEKRILFQFNYNKGGYSMNKQIDERIARLLQKFTEVRGDPICKNETVNWGAPMAEEAVAAFEKSKGIRLPEEYRRFITVVGADGKQPFYGLTHLNEQAAEQCVPEQPFPFTLDDFPFFLYMTEEEMDDFDYDAACAGFLHLCTEGCGMDSILIVNSADPAVYGTVWFFDFANDYGAVPMRDEKTGEPFRFLDWLEYWTDHITTGSHSTFADTAPVPPPPDNPEILGRKMGWITE